MSAAPPLIPDNSNYDDSYSTVLKTTKTYCSVLTDGTATLSSGTMSNVTWTPIVGSDAITKSYITGTAPGGPLQSIQYNYNGVFGGSSNLIFNNNKLIFTGSITDGTTSILNSTISSLANPVSNQQIATKNYVDSFSKQTQITQILTNAGVTYTSASVVGGIIVRNSTVPDITVSDIMPTATNIINHLTSSDISVVIGTPFKFILMNTKISSESDNFNIVLNPGTGITFNPTTTNILIPQDYVLSATLIITNVVSPAVTMNINCVNIGSNYLTKYFYNNQFFTSTPYKVDGILLFPINENSSETTIDYQYTLSDIKNSLIVRNPSGNSNDTITNLTSMNGSFIIQNISSNSITLFETGSWVFRITSASLVPTGSSITIGASQVGNFWYECTGTQYLTVIGIS